MGGRIPDPDKWRYQVLHKDSPSIEKVILKCIAMSPTTANKLHIATGYSLNTVNIAMREAIKQKRVHICAYERNDNSWGRIYLAGPGKNVPHPRFKNTKPKVYRAPAKPLEVKASPAPVVKAQPICGWLGI